MKDKFVYYCLLLNHKGEILAKTGSPDPKHHEVVSSVVPPPCCPSDHGLNHAYPFSNGSRCCANNEDNDDKALSYTGSSCKGAKRKKRKGKKDKRTGYSKCPYGDMSGGCLQLSVCKRKNKEGIAFNKMKRMVGDKRAFHFWKYANDKLKRGPTS